MSVDVNLDLIREEFGRVVYTHKTHEKARELCTRHATASKWVNIVLNALTFGGVLTSVTSENRDLLFVALFFATLTAGYTLYQLSFNPTQEAAGHRDAAKCLLKIRDGYIHLLADVEGNALSAKEIRNQRDGLSAQSQKVFLTAPDTSSKAYGLARRALKESEDFTFSDEEIDKFLPMNLRKDLTEPSLVTTYPTGGRRGRGALSWSGPPVASALSIHVNWSIMTGGLRFISLESVSTGV